jgi:cytidylate kinase
MTQNIGEEVAVEPRKPAIVTYGGEARSGKGSSVRAVRAHLEKFAVPYTAIDQGLKFRVLADMALDDRQPLEDEATMSLFLGDDETHAAFLEKMEEVAEMDRPEIEDIFYRQAISDASRRVGRVPVAHTVVIELLEKEVRKAAEEQKKVILIDGRTMEKYARRFEEAGIARNVLGFYFRCDAAIAARRSLGLFVDHENMTDQQKLHLLSEIINISERNRSDTLRSVDPMREPARAFDIDLASFYEPSEGSLSIYGKTQAALRLGMVKLNTSYTRSIEEMTQPVVDMTAHALVFRANLDHTVAGITVLDTSV